MATQDNKVEQRRVNVGRAIGDRWVISQGLKEGDRVIVDGFQKTAPGATIQPQPWSAENPAADQAGAASGQQAPAAEQQQ